MNELATKCTSSLTGMPRNPNRATSTMADAEYVAVIKYDDMIPIISELQVRLECEAT